MQRMMFASPRELLASSCVSSLLRFPWNPGAAAAVAAASLSPVILLTSEADVSLLILRVTDVSDARCFTLHSLRRSSRSD